MLWIGNTDQTLTLVKAPYSMTVLNQDIDAATTTRSASGVMTRDVVRNGENNVRKIEPASSMLATGRPVCGDTAKAVRMLSGNRLSSI